jgi:hypothetical protein
MAEALAARLKSGSDVAPTPASTVVLSSSSPLVVPLVVLGLWVALERALGVHDVTLGELHAPGTDLTVVAPVKAALENWAAASFVCIALMAAAVVLAAGAIARSDLGARRVSLLLGAVGALFIWLVGSPAVMSNHTNEQEYQLLSTFSANLRLVSRIYLAAVFSAALLVAASVGASLWAAMRAEKVEALVAARRQIRDILAVSTAWLVCGIIGTGLFHRVSGVARAEGVAAALRLLGPADTVFVGVLYSGLLAGVFAPAEYVLRQQADRFLPAGHLRSSETGRTLLADGGIDFSVQSALLRAMAVLGPLLAGVAQSLFTLHA